MPRAAVASRAVVSNRAAVIRSQNLYKNSNDILASGWTASFVTVSSSQADPFGGTGAQLVTVDGTNNVHQWFASPVGALTDIAGVTYTYSEYFKADTGSWVWIGINNGATGGYWDIANGVPGTLSYGTGVTYKIESVGGGWFRISITFIRVAGTSERIAIPSGGNGTAITWLGNSTTAIRRYLGQLTRANWAATPQVATASAVNTGQLRNGVFQAQNFILYSDNFSDASWTKNGLTATVGNLDTTDPWGGNLATKLVESAAFAVHNIFCSPSGIGQRLTAFSIIAKAGTRNWIGLRLPFATISANFNLSTGVLGGVTAGVDAYMTDLRNGWWKCTIAAATTTTFAVAYMLNADAGAGGTGGYTGDGTSALYIIRAQVAEANWTGPSALSLTTGVAINTGTLRNLVSRT